MLISVVNHTTGKLSDEEVQDGVRAPVAMRAAAPAAPKRGRAIEVLDSTSERQP